MTSDYKRVGVFGGTFNPLHQGHLIVAEFAAETLSLDLVLFAPVGQPPHKNGRNLAAIEHRIQMIDSSITDNSRFQLSLVDVERPAPHYSVDTVKRLKAQYEQSQLFFVMGGDALKDFPSWHRPSEIVEYCRLAVMRRPSSKPVQPDMHEAVMPGLKHSVDMIEAPPIGISSTRIREQLAAGKSVRYLVPNPVLDYIHAHRLYSEA